MHCIINRLRTSTERVCLAPPEDIHILVVNSRTMKQPEATVYSELAPHRLQIHGHDILKGLPPIDILIHTRTRGAFLATLYLLGAYHT